MEIRIAAAGDISRLMDIDGTIESMQYLHLECQQAGFSSAWRLEERPLREKLIAANPLDDEAQFTYRQIISGADEGLALIAEHEGMLVASLLAQPDVLTKTLRVIDVRVDYDYRRQGIGLTLLYRSVQEAIERQYRAVTAKTLTNNVPAGQFLLKGGFELAGLDTQFHSNHDLVKEAVALFWYVPLD